ncbi:cell envelope integrity protein TolA [Yersinia ruckeri]|uniref:cell envelope integrity protein TolA n=1 Tax=Yersinia ruckeri TaxID=29486 RepID=UPI0020BEBFEE|nr:energy transducer TonB [Yersinia ruckeri]ELM3740366.1 energy transducer TonB [Yersinia ruckeri]MCK8553283.1 energy transducer TonB [Yersinia ruckeri]MCW6519087.1 energy transducer TonB [Yersinia ruckeri]MCW6553628.1 energy transducer TonB [Yersinia ruckeri]MCW6559942.1 energy transducer TonB [Yersinia ruckeri]
MMNLSADNRSVSMDGNSSVMFLSFSWLLSLALHFCALWFLAMRTIPPLPTDSLTSVVISLSTEIAFTPSLEQYQLGVEQELAVAASESPPELFNEVIESLPEVSQTDALLLVVKEKPKQKQKPKEVIKPQKNVKASWREAAKPQENQETEIQTASMSNSSPLSGTQQRVAAPINSHSLNNSQTRATWIAILQSHLANFKRYPPGVRNKQRKGTAIIKFSIDSEGRVLSAMLAGSSGSTLLDSEALAMLKRAQPLPKPPAELLSAGQFVITLPLDFDMKKKNRRQ